MEDRGKQMEVSTCCVILAAGEGKRMNSEQPKVMAEVLGKPMLYYVLKSCLELDCEDVCVVTGFKNHIVDAYLEKNFPNVHTVFQSERLGTAHAVKCAENFMKKCESDSVIVLNGDAPFIDSKTLHTTLERHLNKNNSATVISALLKDPTGYGRIIRDNYGLLQAIVEHKDASKEQRNINEISSGAYIFDKNDLLFSIDKIKNTNSQKEYYLPDTIKILLDFECKVDAVISENPYVAMGANDVFQLQQLNTLAKSIFV